MGARIQSEEVDHTPLVSAPELVIEVILTARRCNRTLDARAGTVGDTKAPRRIEFDAGVRWLDQ
jgi:hypothetical protein